MVDYKKVIEDQITILEKKQKELEGKPYKEDTMMSMALTIKQLVEAAEILTN